MDNLAYTYNGNQLTKVSDQVTAVNSYNNQEFKDGNISGDDYSYDLNGNMKSDLNKGIASNNILYNYLNLPTEITKGNQKVMYIYNANGQKQEKQLLVNGVLQTRVQYEDGFVYKDNALEYFVHSEGYVKKESTGAYTYVFQYKDHLGNVRLNYSDANGDDNICTAVPRYFLTVLKAHQVGLVQVHCMGEQLHHTILVLKRRVISQEGLKNSPRESYTYTAIHGYL